METKKIELILCKSVEFGHECVLPYEYVPERYIRLSKSVAVEFELLGQQATKQEIDALRKEQDSIRAVMQSKVNKIEDRIQELLALPSL